MAPCVVGAADVQRDFVHALDLVRDLRTAQDEADLGAVAVPDGQVPSRLDHVDEVARRITQGLFLVLDGLVPGIPDQGVSPDCDHCDLPCCAHDPLL